MDLWKICRDSVRKSVHYKGTNGNMYDVHYGEKVEGTGLVREYHDSHGLCIGVDRDDGTMLYVDPIEITVTTDT